MKKSLFSLICCIGIVHISDSMAQCVIGGTDFTTSTSLFNPVMENDTNEVNGWFNSKVGDLLADQCGKSCNYYGNSYEAVHKGMSTNVIASDASVSTSWDDYSGLNSNVTGDTKGFGGIVANPRVISPYLTEGSGSNMFVAYGNGANSNVLTYTISGLKPGSTVSVSADVYNLFSEENLETALVAMNSKAGRKDLVTQIKLPGNMTFVMQSSGTTLTAGSGQINGNKPSVTLCTDVLYGQPAGDKTSTGLTTFNWGSKETLKLNTKVSSTGTITLYFKTASAFAPIGIDNILVTGQVAPEIKSQKMLPVCPANPVLLTLKSSYPDGTTYKWTTPDGSATTRNCTFEPKEAEKTYDISCEVTLPGCTKETTNFKLTTKKCCSTVGEDGKEYPMALTNIFYDDFGKFLNANTYEYTDAKGNVYTEPTTGIYGAGDQKRASCTMQPGAKFNSAIKPCSATGTLNDSYAITNVNPYNPGVEGDASGDPMGCMLVFDLSGTSCNGTPVKDMVVYEREVCGLCKGKEITFSAKFGAINNQPPVGEMAVILRQDNSKGKILWEESETLQGGNDWIEKGTTFEISEEGVNCVVMQVVNKQESFATSQGDYAIDDIVFTVCTPPDVAVDAELTNGTDLLDLCTDEILTLKAEISESAKNFYGSKLGYLYQYTYDNPETTEASKIKWIDLGPIQKNIDFVIDGPANHPAFSPLVTDPAMKGLNIYFRVVIGKSDYLENDRDEWSTMDAQSPCRAISISSIPIVAALNCAACSHLDFEDKGVTFTADNGKFDAKKKVVELCAGESVELGIKDAVHGVDKNGDDYNDYEVKWFKEDVSGTALETKKCATGSDDVAPTLTVSYDDVESAGATGVKYIISFHDYFDPTMATTPCDMTDTITVIANPKPDKTLDDPDPFCEGTLASEPNKSISGYDISWYEDSDTLTGMDEPVIGGLTKTDSPKSYYYVLTDTKTGCRGDANEYKVEVNKADANAVDNTKKIEYKKTDAKSGPLKTLDKQSGTTFKTALSMSGYTLHIGLVEGATEATAPDLATAKFGTASTTIPAPTVKDVDSSDDEYLWYYTYMESAEGCLSDTVLVGVVIKGAPSPTPKDAAYCVNSKEVKPMSEYATVASEDPDGKLVFYGTDKTTTMEPTDLPDVSKPGKYTYWVSQISSTGGGESSKQPIVIEVYGVNDVELSEASAKYCKNAKDAKAVEEIAVVKPSSDEYVQNSGWEFFEANEPSLNEKTAGAETSMKVATATAGVYKYYARLKYEVPKSTEVCYGNHVEYKVEIQSVEDPITGTVTYLKAEGVNGFKKPTDQTPDAVIGDADCTDCSIVWYKSEDNSTTIDESEATPKYDASLQGNEEHTYYVKQVNKLGCESNFRPVTIIVSGYPTPTVKNMSVCENSDKLTGNLEAEANAVSGGASASDFNLVWYKSNADGTMDESQEYDKIELSPSVQKAESGSKETAYKYYVLQRLSSSTTKPYAQSAPVPVTVTVNTNPRLKEIATAPKCKGESQKLSEMYDIDIDGCDATYYDANQGSMVTMTSDVVTEGGLYEVKGWYVINKGTSEEETCSSTPEDLTVVFHELDAAIVGSDRTCPGVSVDLDADVTVGGGLKLSEVRYAWTNDANSETGDGKSYKTGAGGLDAAGDVMNVTLEVSSDACQGSRAVKKKHQIVVGDGPLVGKIAFSEANNTEKKEDPVSASGIEFISCGGKVEVKLSGIVNKNNSEGYTLSGTTTGSGKFSSETSGEATLSLGEGTYTLSYINECPTKFDFTILDYSNSAKSTNGKMVICEKENWSAEITDIQGPKPTIEWQKDGEVIAGETNTKLQLNPAKPEDSGVYTYTLYSAGCRFDGKIALGDQLKVKPYVVINENSYEKRYEVVNGKPQAINLEFKVPAAASDIASDVKWSDVNTGFSQKGPGVTIDPVTTDYNLHVVAENNDYCKAETDIEILVDAKLQMKAELERQEICEGETTKLTLDTTGTGRVLHKDGLVLKVTETTSSGEKTIDMKLNRGTGKLEADVSPVHDAKYSVVYTYTVDSQDESRELHLTVHEKFQVELSDAKGVCEGDMTSVEVLKLLPNGTDLDWSDNPGGELVAGSISGATFMPLYTASGVAPQKKTYKVIAKNGLCQDKPFMFDVYVHKPIEGEIRTADKICQFDELTLDASPYQAETYEWKYEEKDSVFVGATASLVPDPDYATFTLKMTRGECSAEVQKYVEVTSAPSVLQVDSIGIRQIEIQMEVGLGTGEFKYIIDGREDDPNIMNNVRDSLSYSEHVVKVIDEVGCSTEFRFVVNNPAIEIPIIISPNGDGVGDKFTVKGLAEGYPDAKVTIFDRWGKVLATYNAGDGNDWTGIYNGVAMPSTDYWYEIQIKEIKKTYTGHFTLIRQ